MKHIQTTKSQLLPKSYSTRQSNATESRRSVSSCHSYPRSFADRFSKHKSLHLRDGVTLWNGSRQSIPSCRWDKSGSREARSSISSWSALNEQSNLLAWCCSTDRPCQLPGCSCRWSHSLGQPHCFNRAAPINQRLQTRSTLRMRNLLSKPMQDRARKSRHKYRGGSVQSTGRLHAQVRYANTRTQLQFPARGDSRRVHTYLSLPSMSRVPLEYRAII
ncbi:hypothetical protein J3F83DRAFT_46228 [Trichoderma novae-zelandiae]